MIQHFTFSLQFRGQGFPQNFFSNALTPLSALRPRWRCRRCAIKKIINIFLAFCQRGAGIKQRGALGEALTMLTLTQAYQVTD